MKMKFRIIPSAGIIGGIFVVPFTPAMAIEPPADNPQPPAALVGADASANASSVSVANLPFIGISTASVPEMLADHLELEGGSGVIIRTVCPDSPAQKAGLSVNDIILSLDGHAIADPDDFTAKIRDRKSGDRVKVDLIHNGKPAKVEVTLTERPEELNAQAGREPFLEGIPKAHADRLRGLIEENLQSFGNGPQGILPDRQFEETFRMMRERMNRALDEDMPPLIQGADGGIRFQQNSTIRLMDNDGSVEIRSSDGDTEVIVRDTANKTVWSGPWNSDEDKDSAPKDVRERIDRVNAGSATGKGFSFRFGKLRPEPDTIDN